MSDKSISMVFKLAYRDFISYDRFPQLILFIECPFSEVDVSLAIREGEGDLSLAHWAKVHEDYYIQQCKSLGVEFQEDLLVVVEGFKLIEAL